MAELYVETGIDRKVWMDGPEALAEAARLVGRAFDVDSNSGPTIHNGPKGLFGAAYFADPIKNALRLDPDAPADFIEAQRLKSGEVVIGWHHIRSAKALGSCAANGCARLQYQPGQLLVGPATSGEKGLREPKNGGAYFGLVYAIANFARSGSGYDAYYNLDTQALARNVLEGKHAPVIPDGDLLKRKLHVTC